MYPAWIAVFSQMTVKSGKGERMPLVTGVERGPGHPINMVGISTPTIATPKQTLSPRVNTRPATARGEGDGNKTVHGYLCPRIGCRGVISSPATQPCCAMNSLLPLACPVVPGRKRYRGKWLSTPGHDGARSARIGMFAELSSAVSAYCGCPLGPARAAL